MVVLLLRWYRIKKTSLPSIGALSKQRFQLIGLTVLWCSGTDYVHPCESKFHQQLLKRQLKSIFLALDDPNTLEKYAVKYTFLVNELLATPANLHKTFFICINLHTKYFQLRSLKMLIVLRQLFHVYFHSSISTNTISYQLVESFVVLYRSFFGTTTFTCIIRKTKMKMIWIFICIFNNFC